VFLDRDGVINRNVFYPDTGAYESPRNAAAFDLFPDCIQSLLRLQAAGFQLFLVSNQPNIAKAKSTLSELQGIQQKLEAVLAQEAIHFVDFFYCYHHPDSNIPEYGGPCECRKPSPYFLIKAATNHGIDLSQSWMIGDRSSDIECGKRAGVHTILIVPDHIPAQDLPQEPRPDHVAGNLSDATSYILEQARQTA
jgi:D-glycero-D-manno-heptose 1,7-bisphosphate phosphatase